MLWLSTLWRKDTDCSTYNQIPRICTVEIIGLSNSAYTIIIVEIMHKPQDEINSLQPKPTKGFN